MSRTPTQQQQHVITAVADSSIRMLKMVACAGGGKTSTLEMIAHSQPVPSLYLAFNKVTATEASERFPKHVTCRTTHSIAYEFYGAELRDKLSRPQGGKYVNVAGTGNEIARYYHLESFEPAKGEALTAQFIGLLVKDTVAKFEQSADAEIESKHVPMADLLKKGLTKGTIDHVVKYVVKNARHLWKDRINLKSKVLATHDTYLKLYQLSKPVIGGVQLLYVDEAQDTTPCVMDIIRNQAEHMRIVLVGDPRQAIYGWRGAVNAMELFKAPSYPLSKSFRYGPEVARIATTVLEGAMKVEGLETLDSKVGLVGTVDRSKPYTRLFRTNAALLIEAIKEVEKGTEVALEIDVKDFVRLLQSAQALFEGRQKDVKHEEIVPYAEWAELVNEGKFNAGLGRVVKAVAEYKAVEWIRILENFQNSRNAHVTFTTAHKSKGREWSQVVVENDFKSCYNDDGEFVGLPTEEQNLLYVAVTRAVDRLEYNKTVFEYLMNEKANSQVEDRFDEEVKRATRELERDAAFD